MRKVWLRGALFFFEAMWSYSNFISYYQEGKHHNLAFGILWLFMAVHSAYRLWKIT